MKMLIGDQWVDSSDNQVMEVHNPGTGELLDTVPKGTLDDAIRMVEAAQEGKEKMRRLTAFQRYEILNRIASEIETHSDELSQLLAAENGKPVLQTRAEVLVTASIFRGFSEEAKRIFGRVMPVDAVRGNERHFAFTIRQPLGVVAAIVPFNYPVELWGHKAAAALAAGNAVISKPPSACPLTLLRIAGLMQNCGLPEKAHQIITGSGAVIGDFMARSEGIQLISVTGSTEVGISIAEQAAKTLKRVHLELGGNDAMIVLSDADLEKAADSVVLGRLARGNGQICCAVKRVLVEKSVLEDFTSLLSRKTAALKVGDQLQEDTDVGPLINERAAEKVEDYVQKAVNAGAKVIAGGKRNGAFMDPTVLMDVSVDMPLYKEEVFGPVVPLVGFSTIDEAVEMANASPFGLQSAVFTKDINKAFDISYRLQAGGVIINWSTALRIETLPFGGIKMSGLGREGIHDTLEEMTNQKTVVVHNAFPSTESD
jgi:lactaldehyde dehydrogenase